MTPPTPLRRLRDQPPGRVVAAGLALLALAGAADHLTGPEVSMSVFYLPSIAVIAWGADRRSALWTAFLAGSVWLGAELAEGRWSHPVIPYWNAGVRLAIFVVVALLVSALRRATDRADAAATDPETGTVRPVPFYERVEHEHASGRPFVLAYVDPGVAADPAPGDRASHPDPVVFALRSVMRADDIVARPRGRELALLLAGLPPEAAPRALERIRGALATVASSAGGGAAGIALGAVTCTGPGIPLNHVIQQAFQLMYAAARVPGTAVLAHEVVDAPAPAATPASPAPAAPG